MSEMKSISRRDDNLRFNILFCVTCTAITQTYESAENIAPRKAGTLASRSICVPEPLPRANSTDGGSCAGEETCGHSKAVSLLVVIRQQNALDRLPYWKKHVGG